MHTSQAGIALIKKYEGLRLSSYKCPAGVWTIGYGHTRNTNENEHITETGANVLLEQDIERCEEAVDRLVNVDITQNMYDALICFTFNLGVGTLSGSTLLSLLNTKQYLLSAREFFRWTHVGGKVIPGLVSRRKEEADLFTANMGVLTYGSTKGASISY